MKSLLDLFYPPKVEIKGARLVVGVDVKELKTRVWYADLQKIASPRELDHKTHCRNGHEYSESNLLWEIRKNGKKVKKCKTCYQARKSKPRTK